MKTLLTPLVLAAAIFVQAAERTDNQQTVNQIRAYEKSNGTYHALIQLPSGRLSGVNPDANLSPCQIWTKNKLVFKQALDALIEQRPLDLTYSGRGDKDSACQIALLREGMIADEVEEEALRTVSLEMVFSWRSHQGNEWDKDESEPKMAMFGDTSFMQVWARAPEGEKPNKIFAMPVDYRARPESSAFIVNTTATTAGEWVGNPNVVVMDNDNYAISWIHWDANNKPTAKYRVFDEDHNEIRAEKNIPSSSFERMQMIPLTTGGFAVIGRASRSIKLDVFDETGNNIHRKTIGTIDTNNRENPDLAQLSNGQLAISWGRQHGGQNALFYTIYDHLAGSYTKRYAAFGGVASQGSVDNTRVVALEDGHAIVLYESGTDLYLQRFNQFGSPSGDAKLVTTNDYSVTDIDMINLLDGSVLVAWTDANKNDDNQTSVWARRFDAEGEPLTAANHFYPTDGFGRPSGYGNLIDGDQMQPHLVQTRNGSVYGLWIENDGTASNARFTELPTGQVRPGANTLTDAGMIVASDYSLEYLNFELLTDNTPFVVRGSGLVEVAHKDLIDQNVDEYTLRVRVSPAEHPDLKIVVDAPTTEHDITIKVIPDIKQ